MASETLDWRSGWPLIAGRVAVGVGQALKPYAIEEEEHGDVTFRLYRLTDLLENGPPLDAVLADFHADLFAHMYREERELFPLLRSLPGADDCARLGARVTLQGLQFA